MSLLRGKARDTACSVLNARSSTPMGQVHDLIDEYKGSKAPNDVLFEIVSNEHYCSSLYKILNHYMDILQSRSSILEDGQITIYDKALLILTKDGRDLINPPATELFFEQILGFSLAKGANAEECINNNQLLKMFLKDCEFSFLSLFLFFLW